jgi:SsrA-binding protein
MVYAKNKKAYHEYEILQTFEAGLSLLGPEVKSIRASRVNIKGAYIKIQDKIELIGSYVHSENSGYNNFDEYRIRNLLLNKNEMRSLRESATQAGYSIVPLEIYQPKSSNKIKVKIALVKGKQAHDKRQALKEKQLDIETKRTLKDYR